MKKITALFLALVFLIGTLASCGAIINDDGTAGTKKAKFSDIYKENITFGSKNYTTAEAVAIPETATDVRAEGSFLRYTDNGSIHFYNITKARVTLSIPLSTLESAENVTANGGFICVKDAEGLKIYSGAGALLASAEADAGFSAEASGFILAERYYVVKNGEVKKSYPIPPFFNAAGLTFTDDYAVILGDDAVFYNDSFEVMAVYTAPEEATYVRRELLKSGKLFVQYRITLDPDATDYDIYESTEKQSLHHVLFDPKTGKTKELDANVLIVDIEAPEANMNKDVVEHLVSYYTITNKRVGQETYYSIMDGNGKITTSLSHLIEGQSGLISALNESYYYVKVTEGYAILNPDGSLFKTVPAIGDAKAFGFYYNSKVYSADFTLVKDLSDVNFVTTSSYDALIYYKTVDGKEHFYRYDKTGEHDITEADGKRYTHAGYEINYYVSKFYYLNFSVNGRDVWDYYSYSGEFLFTADNTYDTKTVATGSNSCLVSYRKDGKTCYVRLSK